MQLKLTLLRMTLMLNDFDQLVLITITADNLILLIFIVYVGGFLEELATISKKFL